MPRSTTLPLDFVVFLASLIGCGADTGGRVAVSGTITMHGAPLESGTIQFVATNGSQMSGASISAGKYKVPAMQGLQPGQYAVRVSAVKEAKPTDEAPGDSAMADKMNEELVPAEFNVRSTLTTEIAGGSAHVYDVVIP
ncbi:MAG: hypothetical protein ABI614_08260 [Planctomycetota bacterium]